MIHYFGKSCCCIAVGTALLVLLGADWPQFRGIDNASVSTVANLPTDLRPDDAVWNMTLPGRCVSGPVVVGDQVITTSSSGWQNEKLHIWSVDADTGQLQWQRNLWATGRTLCHPLTSMAAPTPATDGTHVYVLFSSNDLVCLDLMGNVKWMRALGVERPQAFDDRGLGSSPLLIDDTVVLQIECQGDSFAMGIDCGTGKTRWELTLPSRINWLSPATFRHADTKLALLQTTDQLLIVHPSDGEVVGRFATPGSAIASPVAADGMIFLPSKGLTALRYEVDKEEPELIWQESRLGTRSSSPVVADGKLFVIRSPNILACADAATGDELWKLRLDGSQFWATPISVNGLLYVVSADGIVQVVDTTSDKPKILSKNEMGEEVLGSPAVSRDAIYVRGVNQLWKFANGETPREVE